MKILIVRNDNIGDLICSTPAIEALRKKYPDYTIDIVVNSYNYCAIYNNPNVDNIYCYTKTKHEKSYLSKIKAFIHKAKILKEIRKANYDAVIVMRRGYSKSAELFSRVTNAKFKVGVSNPNGKNDFNINIEKKENQHEVEFCYDALDFLSVKADNENTFFYIDDKAKENYNKYKGYSAFHISSRVTNNQLTEKKLIEIIKNIKLNKFILTAEPKDYAIAERLSKKFDIDFVKTSSFIDLGALFKNLDMLITLDGGSMHLGPAVGVKTLAIFGSTNINRWYPWGYKELVIQDKSMVANNIDTMKIVNKIGKEL